MNVGDFTNAAECLHYYFTHLGKTVLPGALRVGGKVFR